MSTISSTDAQAFAKTLDDFKKIIAKLQTDLDKGTPVPRTSDTSTDLAALEKKRAELIALYNKFKRSKRVAWKRHQKIIPSKKRKRVTPSIIKNAELLIKKEEELSGEFPSPSNATFAEYLSELILAGMPEASESSSQSSANPATSESDSQFGEKMGGLAGGVIATLAGSRLGPQGQTVLMWLGQEAGSHLGHMVDIGYGAAKKEPMAYSELRRLLGTTAVDFDTLRASTQYLTAGFNISANDAVQLAKKFASIAAVTPDNDRAAGLGQSLRDAISYAQAYGVDAQNTSQFLAIQQLYQVSPSEPANRRLFAQLSEAAAYGGITPKMDELLTVVSKFTESSAKQSLVVPNVSGYISMLSALMALPASGLNKNPTVAASVLDDANKGFKTAISREQLGFYQKALHKANPEFSAEDLDRVQYGGIFGSLSQLYDENSQAVKLANIYGDTKAIKHYRKLATSKEETLSLILRGAEQASSQGKNGVPIDTQQLVKQIQTAFNMSAQQATSLMLAYKQAPQGALKLDGFLAEYGYDINKLQDLSALPVLAALAQGGDQAFDGQYQNLLKHDKVTSVDKDRLDKLDHSSKDFKSEVIKLVLKDSTDPALNAQNAQIDIDNHMLQSVEEMVSLAGMIKEGVSALVDGLPMWLKSEDTKTVIAHEQLDANAEKLHLPIGLENATDAQSRESAEALEAIDKPLREHPDDPRALYKARNAFSYFKQEYDSHSETFIPDFKRRFDMTVANNGLLKSQKIKNAQGGIAQFDYSAETGVNHTPLLMRGTPDMVKAHAGGQPVTGYNLRLADNMIQRLLKGEFADTKALERTISDEKAQVEKKPQLYPKNMPDILQSIGQALERSKQPGGEGDLGLGVLYKKVLAKRKLEGDVAAQVADGLPASAKPSNDKQSIPVREPPAVSLAASAPVSATTPVPLSKPAIIPALASAAKILPPSAIPVSGTDEQPMRNSSVNTQTITNEIEIGSVIFQAAFNQAAAVNQLLSGMGNPAGHSQDDKRQNGKTPIEIGSLEKTDKKTGKEVFLIAAYQPKGVGRDDGGAKIPTALLLKNEQQAQAQSQARFGQALRLSFDRLAIDINLLNHYGEPVAHKATGAGKVGSPTPSYIYTDTATGLG